MTRVSQQVCHETVRGTLLSWNVTYDGIEFLVLPRKVCPHGTCKSVTAITLVEGLATIRPCSDPLSQKNISFE